MQMDVANDEVAQRPGGRIKLFGMERAMEDEEEVGVEVGGEEGRWHQEAPPPRWQE